MPNIIPRRIYDFLKDLPPFSFMEPERLEKLAGKLSIRYLEPGQIIFSQGEAPQPHIFIVREGAIHLNKETEGGSQLVDTCDEGDLFGLRPLLANEPYALTAKAEEESLLYEIPIEPLEAIILENPRVSFYLASSFATGKNKRHAPLHQQDHPILPPNSGTQVLFDLQTVSAQKEPVTCQGETSIREAALRMSEKGVGSIIIVDKNSHPLGIITDKDLRRKVATAKVSTDEAVSTIMSSPVVTGAPNQNVADIQIRMIQKHIHHLCITADGTDQTEVVGVISEHDLLVLQGNNPAVLMRDIKKASSSDDLKKLRNKAASLVYMYLQQSVAISFIAEIITSINDAIITRSVQLAIRKLNQRGNPLPGVSFSWMALGSEGRQEQLLRTDQDNALVFADVPKEELEETRSRFLKLAKEVTHILHQVGWEYCPADMMASNPSWCLSLSEWKSQFSKWMMEPTPKSVMYCTIFFDFRVLFGEDELGHKLRKFILETVQGHTIFLSFLAKNALQNPPPLSFFRNFLVEKSGEHKQEFDIKARAMMPLVDAARNLILEAGIPQLTNTVKRFHKLAELEPQNAELFEQAAEAYEILMRLRALNGFENQDSGRYFDPQALSKMQRLQLRNAFRPISDLQSLLSTRFQLGFLG